VSSHLPLVIFPGIHSPEFTREFLAALQPFLTSPEISKEVHIFPTEEYPAYSPVSILGFLGDRITTFTTPVLAIAFSAGVVGAVPALNLWQLGGGRVQGLVAIDGWGVPAVGNFPIYRLSHDYFTHWSSALLGAGVGSFYADPPVEHLELWRSPPTCPGWEVFTSDSQRIPTNALEFIIKIILLADSQ